MALFRSGKSGLFLPGTVRPTELDDIVISDGLVRYWPLDADALKSSTVTADFTGTSDGTLSGTGTIAFKEGQIGHCYLFPGSSFTARITSSVNSGITSSSIKFSVSVWAKSTTSGATQGILVGTAVDSGLFDGVWFEWAEAGAGIDKTNFSFIDSSTTIMKVRSTNAKATGLWYHLVGTYSGSNTAAGLVIYENGERVAQTTINAGPLVSAITNRPWVIGNDANPSDQCFNGSIDDVRIYNRTLDAAEVKAIYQAGLQGNRDVTSLGLGFATGDWLDDAILQLSTAQAQAGAATFAGAGSLSARAQLRQAGLVQFAGAGALSARTISRQVAAARLQGAGSLSVDLRKVGTQVWTGAAIFAGAGTFSVNMRQQMMARAALGGLGSLAALVRQSIAPPFGINVAGAEFATPNFPSSADWAYISGLGIKKVRLPIAWENLQTTLGGSLATTYLNNIKSALSSAAAVGIGVIIDLHNFGAYVDSTHWGTGSPSYFSPGNVGVAGTGVSFLGGGITTGNFTGLWTALATQLVGLAGLAGYGVMNEPSPLIVGTNLLWYPNGFGNSLGAQQWSVSSGADPQQLAPGTNPLNSAYGPAWSINSGGAFGLINQHVPTTIGQQYTLSIYAMVPSGTASLFLQIGSSGASVTVTTTWQRFTQTLASAPSTDTNIIIQVNSGTPGLLIYIADAQVELGASATTWIPSTWFPFAQAAIAAIQAVDPVTPIYVNGANFSSAYQWPWTNWELVTLGGNLVFDAHQYFDGTLAQGGGPGSYSGTYSSYGITSTAGVTEVTPFVNWLITTGATGFLGEFNVPSEVSSTSSSISGSVLTVAGTITGTFDVGQQISGSGITAGPNSVIASLGTGTGGAGTYNLAGSPGNVSGVAIAGIMTASSPWLTLQSNFEHYLFDNEVPGAIWSYIANGQLATNTLNVAVTGGVDDIRLVQMLNFMAVSSAIFAGAGAMSAVASQGIAVSANFGGAGLLSASALNTKSGAATLSGAGALSATTSQGMTGRCTFAGTGGFSADVQQSSPAGTVWSGQATFTGTGGITVSVTQGMSGQAALTGAGSLSVDTGKDKLAAATFAGSGSLSVTIFQAMVAQATLSGLGSLSASVSMITTGAATFAGTGGLSANLQNAKIGAATFGGTGGLSALATQVMVAQATLQGTGSLAAYASQNMAALTILGGVGTLRVDTGKSKDAQATLAGVGGLSAYATLQMQISAILNGVGTMQAFAVITGATNNWSGEARFNGTGGLSISATLAQAAQARLQGTGSLAGYAAQGMSARATFSGTGSLSVDLQKLAKQIAATFVGAGSLSADIRRGAIGVSAEFDGAGGLSARATLAMLARARLDGLGSLYADVQGGSVTTVAHAGSARLAGQGRLYADAQVISAPIGPTYDFPIEHALDSDYAIRRAKLRRGRLVIGRR